MKASLVLIALCAVAVSARPQAVEPVPILRFNNELGETIGSYNFDFKTGDGIERSEVGEQVPTPNDPEGDFGAAKQGSITYKTPEGKTVLITFKAGPNGFEPKVKVSK